MQQLSKLCIALVRNWEWDVFNMHPLQLVMMTFNYNFQYQCPGIFRIKATLEPPENKLEELEVENILFIEDQGGEKGP